MFNVRAQSSNAEGQITKFGLKLSGEEDGGKLVDLDLTEEITTEAEAEAVDAQVPGALRLWQSSRAAQDARKAETELSGAAAGAAAGANGGPFGQYTIPVGQDGFHVVLGESEHVIDMKQVTVVSLRVKATPKTCLFTVKLCAAGLSKEEIGTLADWFGSTRKATAEHRQAVLPFPGRSRKTPGEIGEVASGVHNGQEYAGIIVNVAKDEDEGDMIEVDDCGRLFLVPMATISGSFRVVEEGRDEALADFAKRAKKAKITPSWLALVPALGRAYLSGENVGDWILTAEIVASAVEAAKASA